MKKGTHLMIVQSVLCVLFVVFLSVSVVRLYQEGRTYRLDGDLSEWIYTREKAEKLLLTYLPLFLLSIGTTVVSVITGVHPKNKPAKDAELIRDLTVSRVKTPSSEMQVEHAKQNKLHIGGWCGFAVCMVPILLYCINGSHFDRSDAEGLESVVGALVLHVVPWACIGICCLAVCLILRDKSFERETALAQSCEKGKPAAIAAASSKTVLLARAVVLSAAILFILLGIFNGSMKDVLYKAINICTECIGLG